MTKTVCLRELHGRDRRPDHTLPSGAEMPCTIAHPDTQLDHLTQRRNGKVYAYDDDKQPWPGAIVTLGACKVGDLVYFNRANWVGCAPLWTLHEVVAA